MSLSELFGAEHSDSYYEKLIVEAETKYEFQKEETQLKRLEENLK